MLMKRSQTIIQNFQLLDCGNSAIYSSFTAPENIVEITAPENFNLMRITFQHMVFTGVTDNLSLVPFITINNVMPAVNGDGAVLFASVKHDPITSITTVFNPESRITFETFTDAPMQGNFYVAACLGGIYAFTFLTVIFEGYYNE